MNLKMTLRNLRIRVIFFVLMVVTVPIHSSWAQSVLPPDTPYLESHFMEYALFFVTGFFILTFALFLFFLWRSHKLKTVLVLFDQQNKIDIDMREIKISESKLILILKMKKNISFIIFLIALCIMYYFLRHVVVWFVAGLVLVAILIVYWRIVLINIEKYYSNIPSKDPRRKPISYLPVDVQDRRIKILDQKNAAIFWKNISLVLLSLSSLFLLVFLSLVLFTTST